MAQVSLINWFTIVIVSVLLSACGSQPITEKPPITTTADSANNYLIGVGDKLEVRVWKEPDLSVDAVVRPDGFITVPLAGDIKAAGLGAEELQTALTKVLSSYINSPQVSVIVRDPQSAQFQQRVRVTGAVSQPLSTAWRDGMTVLDVILMSGGITEFASQNSAKLYRKVGNTVKTYPIYLDDILNKGRLDTNYSLMPSDIITVPERRF